MACKSLKKSAFPHHLSSVGAKYYATVPPLILLEIDIDPHLSVHTRFGHIAGVAMKLMDPFMETKHICLASLAGNRNYAVAWI
jgi:hypothetical protein